MNYFTSSVLKNPKSFSLRAIFKMTWLFVLFVACSAEMNAQSSVSSDSLHQPRKERLSTFEHSFKPSFYDTEVYLYGKNDSSKTFGKAIDQLTSAPPETLQGFR